MRIPKMLLTATLLFNVSQSLFSQTWQTSGTTAFVDGQVAASFNNQDGFVQLWGDNAIIFKKGNRQGGLRFGSATDLNAAGWVERMRITDDGKVGIGTASPFYTLDVVGSAKASYLEVNNGLADGGRLVLRSEGYPEWRIRNFNGLGFFPGEGQPTALWLDNSGSVGVGVQDTRGYKFAVNGNAIFTKVVVKANTNGSWPDYVFHPNFSLRPLSEIEQYINQYHHLPEIPSAEEVEKNGLDIGDSQSALLKKIEELTLYVIAQQKEIKELKKEVEKIKADRK